MVDETSCKQRRCNRCDGYRKELERREQGCYLCKSCDNCLNYDPICAVEGAMPVCACDDRSKQHPECSYYQPTNYCQYCGRKLVEK